MQEQNKIGLFGGTFSPIDNAHIMIADGFVNEMELALCYFIPAFVSPFKTGDEPAMNVTPEHTLQMVKLAIAHNPKFRLESFEIDKGGVSYSYETVNYFKAKFPGVQLFMLIGSDQAVSFKNWKNWEKILNGVQLCIAPRYGIDTKIDLIESLTIDGKKPVMLKTPFMEISSTMIRDELREGRAINGLVPVEVEKYIYENKLYI